MDGSFIQEPLIESFSKYRSRAPSQGRDRYKRDDQKIWRNEPVGSSDRTTSREYLLNRCCLLDDSCPSVSALLFKFTGRFSVIDKCVGVVL